MTVETCFDVNQTRSSVGGVNSLADITGTAPLELPPNYGTIDPDTLDNLPKYGPGTILQFRHKGYHVTVDGTGRIILQLTSTGGAAAPP